jgi:hypothetical protein
MTYTDPTYQECLDAIIGLCLVRLKPREIERLTKGYGIGRSPVEIDTLMARLTDGDPELAGTWEEVRNLETQLAERAEDAPFSLVAAHRLALRLLARAIRRRTAQGLGR